MDPSSTQRGNFESMMGGKYDAKILPPGEAKRQWNIKGNFHPTFNLTCQPNHLFSQILATKLVNFGETSSTTYHQSLLLQYKHIRKR